MKAAVLWTGGKDILQNYAPVSPFRSVTIG